MIFECRKQIIEENGDIAGIGVEWTEARMWAENMAGWLCGVLLLVSFVVTGIGGFMQGFGARGGPFVSFAGIACFGATWALMWAAWRIPAIRKSIVFRKDGTILSSDAGMWRTRVEDLKTIEAEQLRQKKKEHDLPYTHGVRMGTRQGRVLHIGKDMEPDDAIELAVTLSEAIEGVKYAETVKVRMDPSPVW